MERECEWEMGTSTMKGTIWLRLKGRNSGRFYHSFINTEEAEELVRDLLQIIREDKERKDDSMLCRVQKINGNKFICEEKNKFLYRREK